MAQEADGWADGGEAWMLLAACRGRDPDLFFTNDGLSKGEARSGRSMYAEAKSICASCDVRLVCLEYAIGTNQMYGLWGGKSRAERSAIRTKLYKRGLTLWN